MAVLISSGLGGSAVITPAAQREAFLRAYEQSGLTQEAFAQVVASRKTLKTA